MKNCNKQKLISKLKTATDELR